MKVHREWT